MVSVSARKVEINVSSLHDTNHAASIVFITDMEAEVDAITYDIYQRFFKSTRLSLEANLLYQITVLYWIIYVAYYPIKS